MGLQYTDVSGSPVDLTNYGGKFQIRPSPGSSILYLTLSSSLQLDGTGLNFSGSNGINPPTSGTIGIYISAISSSLLDFDKAEYDLFIHSASYVDKILEGHIHINEKITIL